MPVDRSSRIANANRVTDLEAANRAAGIAGVLRSRLITERLARKHQDGTLGTATEMHEDEQLKDMNVNVGDTIIHQQVPQAEAQPQANKPSSKLPLAAALLAASGLGAGIASLPYLLDKGEDPVVEQTESIDTDTQYDLRITSGQ
jgi:hypothetical protein